MRQLSDKANEILKSIPADMPVGNTTLMRRLGLTPENYFAFRQELLHEPALIATRRGKGGSVIRLSTTGELPPDIIVGKPKEHDLYVPFLEKLKFWAKVSEGYKQYVVERTAYGGRSADGEWSRPDVSLVSIETYPFLYGRHIDVLTFELKSNVGWGVSSVYEALSHSALANYSYLVIEGKREVHKEHREDELERVEEACQKNGIGLIYFDPNTDQLFEPDIDPRRNDPHPSDLNYFIETFLRNPENKEKIRDWTK